MLMFRERRPAIRTLRGWAVSVLNEAGAIRECGEHGWMQDRGDPHAHDRAFDVARQNPPEGYSPEAAAERIVSGIYSCLLAESERVWRLARIAPQRGG
ncbi:hypothetical protein [Bradyrhizobium japonicum]|jgi:hypothetical protein|uniref:hypothetical protein n=1 Tax=Bradyrhizobium japonicum TaxID=375 RepID=UPI0020A13765|nr:hypothetical protein [Bradyrhizobium japonicum]MCP1762386.1 hypothetical protein [Bradyrhizobium japonicum]MCP1793966.1 hypothetical protein [Bradyrhizobium japonicum]MCP1806399.1 hypothetical protein [Bradyrhizobium japonicum]MCP1815327.1 hypothetical protein [Bradyrhizobium japonicum]MCP1873156.1 hypothetical protein [Bradyrhizobium japonicum]